MTPQNLQVLLKEDALQMEIWDNPIPPAFMFQQYRSIDEGKIIAYEALAILKNADGTALANNLYFDQLRDMTSEWHVAVDRFLVPLAIKCAVEKKRLPVAVNVHLASLCDAEFMASVTKVMEALDIKNKDVLFEVVEPHVPTAEQAECLTKISSRSNPDGFTLIIDDHNFETGKERLERLAPLCEIVKIDLDQAAKGFEYLRANYPDLSIVLERVTFNDREMVFKKYPGVIAQGI